MRQGARVIVVVGALVLAAAALASRPASSVELRWMLGAPINTAYRSYETWGRISTRDAHWGVVFARRCQGACGGLSHTLPGEVFLLRRGRLSNRAWVDSLVAQAQLRPPVPQDIGRLCRLTPIPVRRDLLATICP